MAQDFFDDTMNTQFVPFSKAAATEPQQMAPGTFVPFSDGVGTGTQEQRQDHFGHLRTILSEDDWGKFSDWVSTLPANLQSDEDYDLEGYWLSIGRPAYSDAKEGTHLTDKFKLPNHPSFSEESIYSNEKHRGGKWWTDEQGRKRFTPSKDMVALHSFERLQKYFSEAEPDIVVDNPYVNKDGVGPLERRELERQAKRGFNNEMAATLDAVPFAGKMADLSEEDALEALEGFRSDSAAKDTQRKYNIGLKDPQAEKRTSISNDTWYGRLFNSLGDTLPPEPVHHESPNEKKTEAELYDGLTAMANRAGLNPGVVRLQRRKAKSATEFAQLLQPLAEEKLKELARSKRDAQLTLEYNKAGVMGKIVNGALGNVGYTGEFAVSPWLAFGSSAIHRYGELGEMRYSVDPNGELVVDHTGEHGLGAAAKAVAGAAAEVLVEKYVGDSIGKIASKYVRSPIVSGIGKAIEKSKGKDAAHKFLLNERLFRRGYNKIASKTMFHGILGEMTEENVQSLADDGLGLRTRGSEYQGFTKEVGEWVDSLTDPDTQGEIFLGLVGTMFVQGAFVHGANYAQKKKWEADINREKDPFLRNFLDKKTIDGMSADEKRKLVKLVTSPNFTQENVQRFIKKAKEHSDYQNALMTFRDLETPYFVANGLSDVHNGEQYGGDVVDEALSNGGVQSKYKMSPDWSMSFGVRQKDGTATPTKRVNIDEGTGIALEDVGKDKDGHFNVTVRNRDGHEWTITRDTHKDALDGAVAIAQRMSIHNQLVDARRAQKRAHAQDIIARTNDKDHFVIYDSMDGLVREVPGIENESGFTWGNHAVRLGNGQVAIILDNIKSSVQMSQKIFHEAGIHSGLRRHFSTDQAMYDFLENANSVSVQNMKDFFEGLYNKTYAENGIKDENGRQKKFNWSNTDDPDVRTALEEAFAWAYEKGFRDLSMREKIAVWARKRARRFNKTLPFNDAEVNDFVATLFTEQKDGAGSGSVRSVQQDGMSVNGPGFNMTEAHANALERMYPNAFAAGMKENEGDKINAARWVSDNIWQMRQNGFTAEMFDEYCKGFQEGVGPSPQPPANPPSPAPSPSAVEPEATGAEESKEEKSKGKKIRDGQPSEYALVHDENGNVVPVVEVPLSEISLADDIPNFKKDADPSTGVVPGNELTAEKFDRTVAKPILLLRRKNGALNVVTGRHRRDLAVRTNEATIPAQIVDEQDEGRGSIAWARAYDAYSNIMDEQGTIDDYIAFFTENKISEGNARSYMPRMSKGSRQSSAVQAYNLVYRASPDLFAAYQEGGAFDAEKVSAIAGATTNHAIQREAMKFLKAHPTFSAQNMVRIVHQFEMIAKRESEKNGQSYAQGVLFEGFDDSNMEKIEKREEAAIEIERGIRNEKTVLLGVRNASKEKAAETLQQNGIEISADKESINRRIADLTDEQRRWKEWPSHPDLVARLDEYVENSGKSAKPPKTPSTPSETKPIQPKPEAKKPPQKKPEAAKTEREEEKPGDAPTKPTADPYFDDIKSGLKTVNKVSKDGIIYSVSHNAGSGHYFGHLDSEKKEIDIGGGYKIADARTGKRIYSSSPHKNREDAIAEIVQVAINNKLKPEAEDLKLESVTSKELEEEKRKQQERDAVKAGLEKPIKGNGEVHVQPEFDVGQTGQQDLFSPIVETNTASPFETYLSNNGFTRSEDGKTFVRIIGGGDNQYRISVREGNNTRGYSVNQYAPELSDFGGDIDYGPLNKYGNQNETVKFVLDKYQNRVDSAEKKPKKRTTHVKTNAEIDAALDAIDNIRWSAAIELDDVANVRARSITQRDIDSWNKKVDLLKNGKIHKRSILTVLEKTPVVIQRVLGESFGKDLTASLKTRGAILYKVSTEKHNVPIDGLRELPVNLDDPIAVFKSDTRGDDSIVVLTSIIDNESGNRSIVAIRYAGDNGNFLSINLITSMYGKPDGVVRKWFDKSLIRYVNKQKIRPYLTQQDQLQLLAGKNKDGSSYLTEEDFPQLFAASVPQSDEAVNQGDTIRWSSDIPVEKMKELSNKAFDLINALNKSGYKSFLDMASVLYAKKPEAYDRLKPYLRGAWNANADMLNLDDVPKDEANNIFSRIETAEAEESKPTTQEIEQQETPADDETTVIEGRDKQILHAGMEIAAWLRQGRSLSNADVAKIVEKHFKESLTSGKVTVKDARNVLELGVNLYIEELGSVRTALESGNPDDARKAIKDIRDKVLALIPTETNRTTEQIAAQQFSTVPTEAFVAAWVANISKGEVMLEPSAGIGGLAVFAKIRGAEVVLNEYMPRRAQVLTQLGASKHAVMDHDAGNMNAMYQADMRAGKVPSRPTVIVMNPPFSSNVRTGKKDSVGVGGKHVEEALKLIQPGGRLVAIVGNALDSQTGSISGKEWLAKIGKEYAIRANVQINGNEYAKYGTTFDNNILVIDKTAPDGSTITGRVETLDALPDLFAKIRESRSAVATPVAPTAPSSNNVKTPDVKPYGGKKTSKPSVKKSNVSSGHSFRRPENCTKVKFDYENRTGANGTTVDNGKQVTDVTVASARAAMVAWSSATIEEEMEMKADSLSPVVSYLKQDGRANFHDFCKVCREGNYDKFSQFKGVFGRLWNTIADSDPELTSVTTDEVANTLAEIDKLPIPNVSGEIGDGTFAEYEPSNIAPGSRTHITPLVESAAMASVQTPKVRYELELDADVVRSGQPSGAQLEAMGLACQAMEREIVDERGEKVRGGFLLGDGTGCGKGTMISGILSNYFNKGIIKKAVWFAPNSPLFKDAVRDMSTYGNQDLMFEFKKDNKGNASREFGVAFCTYGSVASSTIIGTDEHRNTVLKPKDEKKTSYMLELAKWLGPNYNGIIVLDESHMVSNVKGKKGQRGQTNGSAGANIMREWVRMFPKARVLYVSATSATEASDMAYLERLGLWGAGTSFTNVDTFVNTLNNQGLAVMEVVARDMKAMGVYIARTLSMQGVVNRTLVHNMSEDEKADYDRVVLTWQNVRKHFKTALHETGGDRAGARTMSMFYSRQQEFFNQYLVGIKMKTVVADAKQAFNRGESPVFQIVNTRAAALARQEAEAAARGEELDADSIDLSPKDILINLVRDSYPTVMYHEEQDGERTRMVMTVDMEGNPVHDPVMMERRDNLIASLQSMDMGVNAIDVIIETFGVENVAEITGRAKRYVRKPGESEKSVETRTKSDLDQEAKDFNDGKRRILVFSKAGGTGRSFHADKRFANHAKRIHYLIQAGWRAADAVQGFGRTLRTNQAQAPEYVLCTTDIDGEKRFLSSIARRLNQMGSLTAGDRSASGSGILSEDMNLENKYANEAVSVVFKNHFMGSRTSFDQFCEKLGFATYDEEGNPKNNLTDPKNPLELDAKKIPNATTLLNRILCLETEEQSELFGEFFDTIGRIVSEAKAGGTYDNGTQELNAVSVRIDATENLWEDETGNGQRLDLVTVKVEQETDKVTFDSVQHLMRRTRPAGWIDAVFNEQYNFFVLDGNNGRVYGVGRASDSVTDGNVQQRYMMFTTDWNKRVIRDVRIVNGNPARFRRLSVAEARAVWEAQYNLEPDTRTEEMHFASGTLLPKWAVISNENSEVYRVKDSTTGEKFIGLLIRDSDVSFIRRTFGKQEVAAAKSHAPIDIQNDIINNGAKYTTRDGKTLSRRLMRNQYYIKMVMPGFTEKKMKELESDGLVLVERTSKGWEMFIPYDPNNRQKADGMVKFLNRFPIQMDEAENAAGAMWSNAEIEKYLDPNRITAADIKTMNEFLELRGLPPVGDPRKKTIGEMLREGERLGSNPREMQKLAAVAAETPHNLTEAEILGLLDYAIDLENLYDRQTESLQEAVADGNETNAQQISIQRAQTLDELMKLNKAKRLAAAEWGRAGLVRRIMKRVLDKSYAGILADFSAAAGRKLTDKEMEDAKRLLDMLKAADVELDNAVIDRINNILKATAARSIKNLEPKHKVLDGKTIDQIELDFQKAIDAIIVHSSRGGGAIIGLPNGRRWIEAIVRYHAAIANMNGRTLTLDEMTAKVHEEIDPFIKAEDWDIWQILTNYGNTVEMPNNAIDRNVRELRSLARSKQKAIDILKNRFPSITGTIPDKPTLAQREADRMNREALAELYALDPTLAGDGKRRMKAIQETILQRMKNEIEALENAIKTGTKIDKKTNKVIYTPEMQEKHRQLEELRETYRQLFTTQEEIDARKRAAIKRALRNRLDKLEAKLSAYESARARKDYDAMAAIVDTAKKEQLTDGDIEDLKGRIAEVNSFMAEMEAEDFSEGTPQKYLKRLEARKKALEQAIAEKTHRLLINDVMPRKREKSEMTKKIEMDPEVIRLTALRNQANKAIARKRDALLRQSAFGNKNGWLDTIGGILSAPRIIRTMADVSAIGTQGIIMSIRHPKIAAKAFVESIKSISEKQSNEITAYLLNNTAWDEYVQMGGELHHTSDVIDGEVPEAFRGMGLNIARPFGREFAIEDLKVVKASERTFGMFLNYMKLNIYTLLKGSPAFGPKGPNMEQKRDLVEHIEVAFGHGFKRRGRGGFGDTLFDIVMWAPRLAVSTLRMATFFGLYDAVAIPAKHDFIWKSTGETYSLRDRVTIGKVIAKHNASALGAAAAVMLLVALLFGDKDDPEWLEKMCDPRSSSFANVKIGNSQLNFFGGVSAWWRFVVQLLSGQKLGMDGVVRSFPKHMTVFNFARSKLSPLAGLAMDGVFGETFLGEKLNMNPFGDREKHVVKHVIESLFVPMSLSDAWETIQNNDEIKHKLLLTPFVTTGVLKHTIKPDPYRQSVKPFIHYANKYNTAREEGRHEDASELLKGHPEIENDNAIIRNAVKEVNKLERQLKDLRKAGQRPSDDLMRRYEEARAKAVSAVEAMKPSGR